MGNFSNSIRTVSSLEDSTTNSFALYTYTTLQIQISTKIRINKVFAKKSTRNNSEMSSENLIFLLIIVIGCIRTMQAATKPPTAANYFGSNAVPAGNPALPSFPLSATQVASLGPIHPDVFQDALLPAVRIALSFIFCHKTFSEFLLQPLLSYKRGYGTETHRVVTSDGYILEVHRILSSPRSRSSRNAKQKPVVFLQHGFVDSSATWVMSGVEHGFGK